MVSQLRRRLTFSNVISLIALFVALGGGTYAAVKLKANQVKTRNIAPNAVTGDKALESSFSQVPSANTANTANSAGTANSANTANTATTANTALNADKLDGAEFCRTNGVLTLDDDETEQVLCTQGPFSIQTFCNSSGANTSAVLRFVTTTAGTFLRSPSDNVASTPTAQILVIVSVVDATGGDPTIPPGSGDFSGGVPSTNDQVNGVGTVRAEATATDEGTCDFTLGAMN